MKTYKILDIHPADAFYPDSGRLIGSTFKGRIYKKWTKKDEWEENGVIYCPAGWVAFLVKTSFHAIKVKEIK